MMPPLRLYPLAAAASLLLAGCVTNPELQGISDPDAGFGSVSARTHKATGKHAVWVQSREEARDASRRANALMGAKALSADAAVQIALLNNKRLQAVYADIGLSSAEVWQQSLPVNPTVSIDLMGIGAARTLETVVVGNILALITKEKRVAVANARFRQAQLRAAEETLRLAADTRRAWIRAVGAAEKVRYLSDAQIAADAASETAFGLGKTGAFTKEQQARQHVLYAEITGQIAEARLEARASREELTRQMGAWGAGSNFNLPNALPGLPGKLEVKRSIEALALKNCVDLDVAKLELEALALSYGLTEATRYVTDLELLAGLEFEEEKAAEPEEKEKIITSARLEIEFVLPIFDTGKARMRKAELSYMRAANQLAQKAVNIRSEARGAYDRYRSTYDIARHYRDKVLPLRRVIEEQAVLNYNGMIESKFELLADTRAKFNAMLMSVDAKQNFWLAKVELGTAIYGGGGSAGGGGEQAPEASAGDGGH